MPACFPPFMTADPSSLAYADQQKAKGKPYLRLVSPAGASVFEFDTEADRDAVVEAVAQVRATWAVHTSMGATEG